MAGSAGKLRNAWQNIRCLAYKAFYTYMIYHHLPSNREKYNINFGGGKVWQTDIKPFWPKLSVLKQQVQNLSPICVECFICETNIKCNKLNYSATFSQASHDLCCTQQCFLRDWKTDFEWYPDVYGGSLASRTWH